MTRSLQISEFCGHSNITVLLKSQCSSQLGLCPRRCVFKRRSHPPPPRLDVSSGTGAAPPSILEPGLGWSTTPAPFRLQVLSPGLEQPHRPSVLWPRPQASVPLPPGAPVAMAEGALAPTEVGRGDRRYTHTELLAVSQRFQQNPSELLITWVLRVYDQGGSALTLSPGELTLLGDLTSDTVFNYRCKALRGGRQPLLTWLLLAWRQRWESFLHFNSTELPFQPWTTMEEGIQLVRELGMLDWIYSELPLPATPEDVPFTPGLQQRLLTAAPSEARVSLVDLLVQGMTVLEAVMKIQAIRRRRPALASQPAGRRQARAGAQPDAQGPPGLAPEPRRAQGEGGQAAHQGPDGTLHQRGQAQPWPPGQSAGGQAAAAATTGASQLGPQGLAFHGPRSGGGRPRSGGANRAGGEHLKGHESPARPQDRLRDHLPACSPAYCGQAP
uniref:Uncharacterized protein n=2 Tax=Equus asinus TaxID=9793 RepID=A0A9L0JR53_EQUAS